jgi:hypothetical protein
MKKQTILLAFILLTTTVFFSCKQDTIKTEEKEFVKKFYLTNDTAKGALSVDIQIELPTGFMNKQVLDSIRATIIFNLFGPEYISRANDTIPHLFALELSKEYIANNAPLVTQLDSSSVYSFNNEHKVEGFSLLSDKYIYSYGIDRSVYMGGAHGLETRNYYNFDLKTGKVITEKDLFIPNYEAVLTDLIKKRIVEESSEIKTVEDLEESIYWTDSIKPNGNFFITDEGISYVFNPYEIAPYAFGETEVSLSYESLKTLLKPNSIVSYLIKAK